MVAVGSAICHVIISIEFSSSVKVPSFEIHISIIHRMQIIEGFLHVLILLLRLIVFTVYLLNLVEKLLIWSLVIPVQKHHCKDSAGLKEIEGLGKCDSLRYPLNRGSRVYHIELHVTEIMRDKIRIHDVKIPI